MNDQSAAKDDAAGRRADDGTTDVVEGLHVGETDKTQRGVEKMRQREDEQDQARHEPHQLQIIAAQQNAHGCRPLVLIAPAATHGLEAAKLYAACARRNENLPTY